jgi:hypothetical protein
VSAGRALADEDGWNHLPEENFLDDPWQCGIGHR